MVKDANKPKGRTSAYAFFILSCREEQKKKNPGIPVNFTKFSKTCSERWKTLAATEKKKFEDMARADKDRYDKEMRDYIPPKGMGKKERKRKKDPNAPKRPPSAFFVFCSEHRPTVKGEYPSLSIGDIAKKLAEMWGKQSSKDRTPYEQKAAALRQKYEKDIAAYRAGGGGGASKRGPGRPLGSTKKAMMKADDDEDDEEEEEEDDDDDEEEDDE